jgi:hypothetical protein
MGFQTHGAAGYRGTHVVLMDAPRIHHGTKPRPLRQQDRKSIPIFVEPEGGFEPPTCRLRGHRKPATMGKAGKVAQLRRADWQGRNGCVKGGTLAETLAEQSRPSGALRRPDHLAPAPQAKSSGVPLGGHRSGAQASRTAAAAGALEAIGAPPSVVARGPVRRPSNRGGVAGPGASMKLSLVELCLELWCVSW